MNFYNKDISEIFKELKTSEKGLTKKEAKKRLEQNGYNKLEEEKGKSNFKKFIEEFNDIMIIILLISAIFMFVVSFINKESYIDSITIIAIVIINALLGFIQKMKSDKAFESLKKMQVSKVKVKRDNQIITINSEEVVVGDILVLDVGDKICADGRIIWSTSFKTDESSLTGESLAVSKNNEIIKNECSISERTNFVFSGTNAVYGKAIVIVTSVGMNTEIGKIANILNESEVEKTPLQVKIDEISKTLLIIISIVIFITFIFGIIKKMDILEMILLSISLAVAAIPEGLPAVITITLSLGMGSMAKKKAIVRKMSSVETLGCTEVICSDKTGTITQNKMQVCKIYYSGNEYIDNYLEDNLLYDLMILNNDVVKNKKEFIGDPTEVGFYLYCEKFLNINKIKKEHKRVGELPFDSDRKMMSTINEYEDCDKLLVKGSFDSIIKKCNRILINNKIVKLTNKNIEKLSMQENKDANKSYRIIACAYKDLDKKYKVNNDLEKDLIFLGMISLIDPPREDVKDAINLCKEANVRPIMITGDSLNTAIAIGKEIGIIENEEAAITGEELDLLSKKELKKAVKKYSVYARVSPLNKLDIVNAWKDNNKIVAMTGDGVNDAPAIKNADIGIGMGITGTDVSKNVSDVVLSDDSFSSIVTAIKEGRRIYDNIRNVLVYLLTGNIAEVLIVFIGILMGIEIFLPIQLLYINLITDSIPSIALAFEKEQNDIMKRKIRKKDSSFFTPFLISKITVSSLFKTIAIILVFFVNNSLYNTEIACTMAFLTIVLLEVIFAYSCRNLKKSVFEHGLFGNSFLNKSMIIIIIIQLIVFLTPVKTLFNICDLSLIQVLYCIIVVITTFVFDESTKYFLNKKFED